MRTIGVSIVLLAALPASGLAQGRVDDSTCGPARTTLFAKPTGEAYVATLRKLQGCPNQGAAAFAAEWEAPPKDTAATRWLRTYSSILRDDRIYDAARNTARRVGLPRATRLDAIGVLVRYSDPMTFIEFQNLDDADLPASSYVRTGQWMHDVGSSGSEPLRPSIKKDVQTVLEGIGSQDPDTVVQKVARYLVGYLQR